MYDRFVVIAERDKLLKIAYYALRGVRNLGTSNGTLDALGTSSKSGLRTVNEYTHFRDRASSLQSLFVLLNTTSDKTLKLTYTRSLQRS